MSNKIYESKWTIQKGKSEPFTISGVIMTESDNLDTQYYIKRALRLIGVKASESDKYKFIKYELTKEIGETNT